jgi:hypothetical protein
MRGSAALDYLLVGLAFRLNPVALAAITLEVRVSSLPGDQRNTYNGSLYKAGLGSRLVNGRGLKVADVGHRNIATTEEGDCSFSRSAGS